jgi:hypothetical protein
MSDRTGVALLAVLVTVLASCGGSRVTRYQDAQMDFGAIERVAVMPFQNLTRDQLAGDRVRDVFANMLLATGSFYVLPHGEVVRVVSRSGVTTPQTPSVDDIVKLGKALQAQAVITGVVKEYGELRAGNNSANAISIAVQMIETETGKVVWSGASTRGGVTFWMRLFGGGGEPLNVITEEAVSDVLDQLFED